MDDDRKLLEAAARAAGMEIVGMVDRLIIQPGHLAGGLVFRNDRGGDSAWNPLTDDGDAFRLMVKLGLPPEYYCRSGDDAEVADCRGELEPLGSDHYAATRRAIVRAAAALSTETK